ncbi:MAG: hypothetical protein JOY62_00670 [Acidobacteriaceae bacterium]|nr:hypothetical protein [Acidobacteriaceae bacterium]MBV9778458.1 hypothetical protein [Acidobacteriaceae bacterium]
MRNFMRGIALLSLAVPLFAVDPFVGTWKLDPKDTKYTEGTPPKDVTLVIEAEGANLRIRATGTYADGSPLSVKYTVPARGGAANVEEGQFDAMTAKRVSDRERINTYTKGGKQVMTRRFVVSKDGKELTETLKGTDAQGNPVSGVDRFDRQ